MDKLVSTLLQNAQGIGPAYDPYQDQANWKQGMIPAMPTDLGAKAGQSLLGLLKDRLKGNAMAGGLEALKGLWRGKTGTPTAPPEIGTPLGQMNPEFTPVGGEGLYNMGRQAGKAIADPAENIYKVLMSRMGK